MRLGRVALLSRVEAVGWVDSRIADAKVAGMTAGCGYGVRICWVGQEAGVMTIRPKAWITKVSSSGSSPSGWLAWGIVGSGIGDAGHDAMGRWKTRTWSCAVQTGNGVSKLARGGEQFKLVPRHITFVAGSKGFGSTGSSSMLKMLSRLVSAEINDRVGLDVHGTQRRGRCMLDSDTDAVVSISGTVLTVATPRLAFMALTRSPSDTAVSRSRLVTPPVGFGTRFSVVGVGSVVGSFDELGITDRDTGLTEFGGCNRNVATRGEVSSVFAMPAVGFVVAVERGVEPFVLDDFIRLVVGDEVMVTDVDVKRILP